MVILQICSVRLGWVSVGMCLLASSNYLVLIFEEYASFLDEDASNVDEETLIALKEFVLWLPFLSNFYN